MERTLSYLALGDSYTIGEALPLSLSFPYQTVQLLRQKGVKVQAPEILAKTGWTTDELESAMSGYLFLPSYDFVTLLIGVNNQYRGRTREEYGIQFERLLKKALELSGNDPRHVLILSIPDYGVTPFGLAMDPDKIAAEINGFNLAAEEIAAKLHVQFINITDGSREAKFDSDLVASDGLHPSEKEYAKWASAVAAALLTRL